MSTAGHEPGVDIIDWSETVTTVFYYPGEDPSLGSSTPSTETDNMAAPPLLSLSHLIIPHQSQLSQM